MWFCYSHLQWDSFMSAGRHYTDQVSFEWDFLHVLQYHQFPQELLEDSWELRFTQIQGKNVFVITKQLHVAVVSCDEVGNLPDETNGDIVQGFPKCSNEDLKKVFKHLLSQERIDHFFSHSPIATSSYGSSSSEHNTGVVNHQVSACFNCGGDYGLHFCNKPLIKILLLRLRLSLKKRRTLFQVVVTMVEDILVVVGLIRAKAIMSRTSLELPILPIKIEFSFWWSLDGLL